MEKDDLIYALGVQLALLSKQKSVYIDLFDVQEDVSEMVVFESGNATIEYSVDVYGHEEEDWEGDNTIPNGTRNIYTFEIDEVSVTELLILVDGNEVEMDDIHATRLMEFIEKEVYGNGK